MRTLTQTLLAAQQSAGHIPYVRVLATNTSGGVVKLNWTRLYTGAEGETSHGLTLPSDGSFIRARIGPAGGGSELYRQRVVSPGPLSDFSQWIQTGYCNVRSVALASGGTEVNLLWQDITGVIYHIQSNDYGATWSGQETLGVTGDACCGLTVAYKPNGDLAFFYTSGNGLCVVKRTGGTWQNAVWLDQSTGQLYSVAAVFDGDWNLALAGLDTSGNFKVWSVVFGDGGSVPVGSWSALKEIATAPAGGSFEYRGVFLDKPDVFRAFFVEKYTGARAYTRVYWTHLIDGADFSSGLWREPAPFDHTCECGMALAHRGGYCWLSTPDGVWRAGGSSQQLDVSADVAVARCESGRHEGKLTVELANADGKYHSPGTGSLAVLDAGCRVSFSPGYVTGQGSEASDGPGFWLEGLEHSSAAGRSALVLHTVDGWGLLEGWRARHQFRWNKDSQQANVKQIIEFVLARVGLKLAVKSQSSVVTGFYPDIAIHPGDNGLTIIERLVSIVPDFIFMEGETAYLVNPLVNDASVYVYGSSHAITEGSYFTGLWKTNQVRVEGDDQGTPVVLDVLDWGQLEKRPERWRSVTDVNIATVSEANDRGQAVLRKAGLGAVSGAITVPVNCGQQLFDVIEVTDSRVGLTGARKRVLGVTTVYMPARGEYRQKLLLGGV